MATMGGIVMSDTMPIGLCYNHVTQLETLVWVTSFLPLNRFKGGYHEMASLILVIAAIISAITDVVDVTVAVLDYVREGKRRRSEKTGKHCRPK